MSFCAKREYRELNRVKEQRCMAEGGQVGVNARRYLKWTERSDKYVKGSKRAYLPASATLESALVIPLYVYSVLAVMYIMQILLVKSEVDRAAYNSLRTLSKYAYAYEKFGDIDNTISAIAAYTMLVKELGTDFADTHNIVGGTAGISIIGSEIPDENGKINLKLAYCLKNPFDIFGLGIVKIKQNYAVQAWLGQNDDEETQADADGEMVYITPNGTVYHTKRNCTYILLSVREVALEDISSFRNDSGGRYYPCEKCYRDADARNVYITEYGTRYHTSLNCSILKRIVLKVPLEQANGRKPCAKCAGGL